jgi:hypothetical protein
MDPLFQNPGSATDSIHMLFVIYTFVMMVTVGASGIHGSCQEMLKDTISTSMDDTKNGGKPYGLHECFCKSICVVFCFSIYQFVFLHKIS